jgi:hypothetical protein
MPRKPRIMDGRNPSSSRMGFKMLRIFSEAISEIKIAIKRLMGRASKDERIVTATDPTIRGSMPRAGGVSVGYQSEPVTIDKREASFRTGSPSLIKKKRINNMIKMPIDDMDIMIMPGACSFFMDITIPFP